MLGDGDADGESELDGLTLRLAERLTELDGDKLADGDNDRL